jgi:hypothetical protein
VRGDTERSLVHHYSWFAGFCRPVTLPACDSLARILDLVFDPVADVAPLVANMSSHPEPTGSFSAIPPLVERGCRHTEIFGEVLHSEEAIREFHCPILLPDPVNKVFVTLSSEFQSDTSLPMFKPGIASISGLRAASLEEAIPRVGGLRTLC